MLFVIYRTLVIRYGILLFIFVIRYSYAVFRYSHSVFVIRYSYALLVIYTRYLKFFFRITLFCAVTNYESNAITCFVRNRKIYSKIMKSLR